MGRDGEGTTVEAGEDSEKEPLAEARGSEADAGGEAERPLADARGSEEPAPDNAVEAAVEAEAAPDPVAASLPRVSMNHNRRWTMAASGESVDEQELAITVEAVDSVRARLKAIIEAVIYITDEPLNTQQIAGALNRPIDQIKAILDDLTNDYGQADRGLTIREVAGGYKMATKPEHHEADPRPSSRT